jgi:gamma-glutamyl-gamma-aminobutyrate hydrolase PuuD
VGICAVIRRVGLPFGRAEAHAVFSAYVHAVANAGTMPVPHVEGHLGDSVRHVVDVLPSGGLAAAAGSAQLETNSLHHQAAGEIGTRLRVTARAADGTVEALESDGPAPVLAVQWHPELDAGAAASAPFAWLAERAEAARCS